MLNDFVCIFRRSYMVCIFAGLFTNLFGYVRTSHPFHLYLCTKNVIIAESSMYATQIHNIITFPKHTSLTSQVHEQERSCFSGRHSQRYNAYVLGILERRWTPNK